MTAPSPRRVLVTGGKAGATVWSSCELFQPASGEWSTTGSLLSTSTISVRDASDNITGGSDGGQYDARYDRATAGAPATCKVVIYNAGAADGGDEVANATDLSAVTFLLTITGR
jgi:hypothetical protein